VGLGLIVAVGVGVFVGVKVAVGVALGQAPDCELAVFEYRELPVALYALTLKYRNPADTWCDV
jgi:tRNA A37 threonylcarbamoyladenosine modification protein TsaB